ncbi:MAG: hypothetical protein LBG89_03335 [Rickettsiales bacterium]|jgi:hypothetical protein|nr:hypothetical protein [Rickettsiales bacterium]
MLLRFVPFIIFAFAFADMAAADSVRDPRKTNNYSAGKGVGQGSVSVSFGDGSGVNLITEAPGLIQQAQEAEAARLAAPLPIRVANPDIERLIRAGDISAGVDLEDLEICRSVNPTSGAFAWDRPNFRGTGAAYDSNKDTCVAEVSLVARDVSQAVIVAKMNVPVGATFECNIDSFPESGFQPEMAGVVFPADREPTREDVEKQMDKERAKNPLAKTIGGVLVGGLMGNMIGANDSGGDGLFGTNKDKMIATGIGAAAGGTGMYVAQNTGHVVGSTIESAMIAGAGGTIIGNITAGIVGGNAILDIRPCKIKGQERTCIIGMSYKINEDRINVICNTEGNFRNDCLLLSTNQNTAEGRETCRNFKADGAESCVKDDRMDAAGGNCANVKRFSVKGEKGERAETDGKWIAGTCNKAVQGKRAVMEWNGKKDATLADFRKANPGQVCVYPADLSGNSLIGADCDSMDFDPSVKDASDGGIIDFNNSARNTGTLIGTGVGTGVGALAGYKGAGSALDDRWHSAVLEYADSMKKFKCYSGGWLLGDYRNIITIPSPILP